MGNETGIVPIVGSCAFVCVYLCLQTGQITLLGWQHHEINVLKKYCLMSLT